MIVVLFNNPRHAQGLYSAVETGTTFFSLPSFIFTFLPPSLAKPGTSAGAGGGRLNVYDAIKSSVVHAATFRARTLSLPVVGSVLGVCRLGDKEGKPYSVRYDQVNAMLLNEFLKEHRKVQQLEVNAARQQQQINVLSAGLQRLSAQLAAASPSRGGLERSKPAPQIVTNDR